MHGALRGAGALVAALALTTGLVALGPGTGGQGLAASAVQGSVWVADEDGNGLTVVDAATNRVVTRLTGIEGPHNVQVAPDGRSVWAVSGHDSLAVMIDAQTYQVHGAAPTGRSPAHVIITSDGARAYVTNGDDNTVTVIDVATMQAVATIPVGEYPHGLRPSPDGRWVYVANAKGTTVSVIDTQSDARVADIDVGRGPVQVGFSPDGTDLYVSLNGEDALGKVDVATRTLVAKTPTGVGPLQVFVTPDDRAVLVANQGTRANPSMTVSFVDVASFSAVDAIETGRGAHGVAIEPSGAYAYVTNIYGDDLAVLDVTERRVVATVRTGATPNGVSFSPLAAAPAPAAEIRLALPGHDERDDEGPGHEEPGHDDAMPGMSH